MLGVERCGAAGTRCCDRLAVGVVDGVAARDHSRDVRPRGPSLDHDVPLGVQFHLPDQQLGARHVADRHEDAGGGDVPHLAGLGVTQRYAGDLLVTLDRDDLAVPREGDLRVVQRAVGHDLRRPELVAAVDDRHLRREPREERGLLDGGVPTADHEDLLLPEEEPVARRAPGHSSTRQSLLVVDAELAIGRTGREDHGIGGVGLATARDDRLDLAHEGERRRVVPDHLGAEALSLLLHVLHELRALDARGKPREVLDLGRVHQRAARGDGAGDDQGS
ncbi:hypothetical protein GALL_464400 [mine drainage metagenome]|uniref:Uncharacterized protein n=1 Tax=mine drainage metagenome TaxID=410659 RepID=A0A1J5Q7M1_9ZZZZ